DGSQQELRWSYAGKGCTAYAFCNGKTGTAFPEQWAVGGTRPATIETESYKGTMMRNRTVKDGRSYSCYRTCPARRAWTMWTSLPCVHKEEMEELKRMLQGASTAAKAAYSVELSRGSDGSAEKYAWTDSTFGGTALCPRAERSVLVAQGDEMNPGRVSGRDLDHALLQVMHESHCLRYNAVPEVTVLDVNNKNYDHVDWHLIYEIPGATFWEVGLHVRVYKSPKTSKMGLTLVVESLTAHGQSELPTLVSFPPLKRARSFFTD
ncbi:hypothetical protein V8E36_003658, partial [Tilletia maclaganii]